jgi:hypothetical protein
MQKSKVNDAFNLIQKKLNTKYTIDCNVLKKVYEAYKDVIKSEIFANNYDVQDQDYFAQYVICHKVFTIASMDEFCPNLVLNHNHMDDLKIQKSIES